MASFSGYVFEKPRVGSANSSFTPSPDNLISDQSAYDAVYGTDETTPGRTEYLTLVFVDGDLADSEFGWTKNESDIQRFDYFGQEQRFRTLPGSTRIEAGVLAEESNTTRISLSIPVTSALIAPYRVALGSIGSGTTFTVVEVATDASFSSPSSGTVELSLETGNLHWAEADLTSFAGQTVYHQRQTFFTFTESTGRLGIAGDVILLNPIPAIGQHPLIRFGFGLYLTPVGVATEGGFSADPVQGTFEWAQDTGRVAFNSVDLTNNTGEPVYYDGVVFDFRRTLSRESIGTVSSPTTISTLPGEGADLIFRAKVAGPTGTATFPSTVILQDTSADFVASSVQVGDVAVLTTGSYAGARRRVTSVSTTQLTVAPPFPSVTGADYEVELKASIYQFPESERVTTLASPGKTDVVQVDGAGDVRFSDADQSVYGSRSAEVVFGDLLIERGISLRLFRTPVDLTGQDPDLKDVTSTLAVENASLADPIIGQPTVFLPVLPIDDGAYPMVFVVQQGTGSFTGTLPRLDVGSPVAGFGYTLDFDQRLFSFARRRNNEVQVLQGTVAATSLPDALVSSSNVVLELNQGTGYVTLTEGSDYLLDSTSGVVTFISKLGSIVIEGTNGFVQASSLSLLEDSAADFVAAGVQTGDFVSIPAGTLQGVYGVVGVNTGSLQVEPVFTVASTSVSYQVLRNKETLANRFFQQVLLVDRRTKLERIRPLGTITNSPRFSVPLDEVSITRYRFSDGSFSEAVTVVLADTSFSSPSSLDSGYVEVSYETGNLNFSQSDVDAGGTVYSVLLGTQGTV